jgi:DNA-directed RNA polymerase subunit K/omega
MAANQVNTDHKVLLPNPDTGVVITQSGGARPKAVAKKSVKKSTSHHQHHHTQEEPEQQDSKSFKEKSDLYFANDYRLIMSKYDAAANTSRPVMTQYEKTLILGERATQFAYGTEPNIEVKPGMTVIEMATEELRQRKCPFIIKRYIGEIVEYWRPEDMEIRF